MDHDHRGHRSAHRRVSSLFGGGGYGRLIGIFATGLGALESLLSIGGTHPWWSLAIFALRIYILDGLIVYGEEEPARA